MLGVIGFHFPPIVGLPFSVLSHCLCIGAVYHAPVPRPILTIRLVVFTMHCACETDWTYSIHYRCVNSVVNP